MRAPDERIAGNTSCAWPANVTLPVEGVGELLLEHKLSEPALNLGSGKPNKEDSVHSTSCISFPVLPEADVSEGARQ